ncbi:NUDIX domain-containing protein [Deinococcus aestuarii]|uniref:NUDIX domain-containing protein n=1 Tax=Deinococcus aestuarii TaxID=2774531 RepID=UPI001FE9AD8B|nr:NUDIX domain-containing protein [Deinococcus aestuarii]
MTSAPRVNLSPSPHRTGRACVWIEHAGRVLMVGLEWGGWTLPGGGIDPGETGAQAAEREAWEECGARVEIVGEAVTIWGQSGVESLCYPARLLSLDPSPEGRPVAWVNPRSLPWADDVQLRQVLAGMGETPAVLALPERVRAALAETERLGFGRSCSLEVGRLLRTLAASRPGGRLAELGTGTGVGAAWLLAGMNDTARLFTTELDPERADVARRVLGDDPRAEVLGGDWREVLTYGPFDLIFSDCAPAKRETESLEVLVDALGPGGVLVLDNFSPAASLPASLHGGDPERDRLFSHPRLLCAEVPVSRRECVILATRRA